MECPCVCERVNDRACCCGILRTFLSWRKLHIVFVVWGLKRLNLLVMKEVKNILLKAPRLEMRKSVEVQVDSDFTLLLPTGIYEIKKMEPRRRLRSIVLICVVLAVSGIIGFGYFCPDQVC